jgi:hypothetical protein
MSYKGFVFLYKIMTYNINLILYIAFGLSAALGKSLECRTLFIYDGNKGYYMVETLNDKLKSMDENVAKIVDAGLHQLELVITKGDHPDSAAVREATEIVDLVGKAIKSLADGLESYRMTTKYIRQDAAKP